MAQHAMSVYNNNYNNDDQYNNNDNNYNNYNINLAQRISTDSGDDKEALLLFQRISDYPTF